MTLLLAAAWLAVGLFSGDLPALKLGADANAWGALAFVCAAWDLLGE